TSVWSDESPYTYFPISSKKGPSKSDCCLKVVRLANNRFDWQADQCNFLKKLTSDMVNMSLANTTANATVFSWSTSGTNWEPSRIRSGGLETRGTLHASESPSHLFQLHSGLVQGQVVGEDLKPAGPFTPPSLRRTCFNYTVDSFKGKSLVLAGLDDLVIYDVKAHPVVDGFPVVDPPIVQRITTAPSREVYYFTTPEGVTTVTWATLVSQDQEDYPVQVSYCLKDKNNCETVSGTALSTKIGKLEFSKSYNATITETNGLKRSTNFQFVSGTMCTSTEFQTTSKDCFWVRQKLFVYLDALNMCKEAAGGQLATLYSSLEEELAANLSKKYSRDLWIVERTLRRKRQTDFSEGDTSESQDVEVIGVGSTDSVCWAIGVNSQLRENVTDCRTSKKAALCHRSIAARTGMPVTQLGSQSSFKIERHSKAAKIGWISDPSSWKASFSITVSKNNPGQQSRRRRSIESFGVFDAVETSGSVSTITKDFNSPPVVLEGLEQGVSYTASITGDIGAVSKERSGSFTIPGEINVDNLATNKAMEILWNLVTAFMIAVCVLGIMTYVASGAYFFDVVLEIGMLLSLFVANLVLLVKPPYQFMGSCESVAHALHFLFIAACANLAAEAVTVYQRLHNDLSTYGKRTQFGILGIVWGIPAIMTGIMAGVKSEPGLTDPLQPGSCESVAHALHFLFIAACANLAAEAVTVYQRLHNDLSTYGKRTQFGILGIVWGIPAIMTGIMAGVKSEPGLTDPLQPVCWLKIDRRSFHFWWSVVPIYGCISVPLMCGILHKYKQKLQIAEAGGKTRKWTEGVDGWNDALKRTMTYNVTWWTLIVNSMLLGVYWAMGVATIQDSLNVTTRIIFFIFCIILGVALLCSRVLVDLDVKSGLKDKCFRSRTATKTPLTPFSEQKNGRPFVIGGIHKEDKTIGAGQGISTSSAASDSSIILLTGVQYMSPKRKHPPQSKAVTMILFSLGYWSQIIVTIELTIDTALPIPSVSSMKKNKTAKN
ncbi:unnamed protein product, partial [Notodromas monacha]